MSRFVCHLGTEAARRLRTEPFLVNYEAKWAQILPYGAGLLWTFNKNRVLCSWQPGFGPLGGGGMAANPHFYAYPALYPAFFGTFWKILAPKPSQMC